MVLFFAEPCPGRSGSVRSHLCWRGSRESVPTAMVYGVDSINKPAHFAPHARETVDAATQAISLATKVCATSPPCIPKFLTAQSTDRDYKMHARGLSDRRADATRHPWITTTTTHLRSAELILLRGILQGVHLLLGVRILDVLLRHCKLLLALQASSRKTGDALRSHSLLSPSQSSC